MRPGEKDAAGIAVGCCLLYLLVMAGLVYFVVKAILDLTSGHPTDRTWDIITLVVAAIALFGSGGSAASRR